MSPTCLAKIDRKKRGRVATESTPEQTPSPESKRSSSVGLPLFLQPKLAISQPGDLYEQEADRVAEHVMRMPEPKSKGVVQRACAACAAGGPPCLACDEEKPVTVSRKAQGGAGGDAPASVHSVIGTSGQPMGLHARAFFEPRFGQDLGHVRVHTDGAAQQSARDVNALAYTVGSHVVFDAGRYAPGTPAGQRLIAHELTHVVQQAGNVSVSPYVARKQTEWPLWHQDILRDVINLVSATADLGEAVQWRWLLRYLCGLSQERAQSLHARWNRTALAVPGNKDDFPLFILANFGAHYDDAVTLLEGIGTGTKPGSCTLPQEESPPAVSKTGTAASTSVPAAQSGGAAPSDSPPESVAGVATGKEMRVHAPTDPGWVSVQPIYFWVKAGEPFFLPHFLKVLVLGPMAYDKKQIVITIQEGKYEGKDAIIDRAALRESSGIKGYAGMSFDIDTNELYYGGQGPVQAVTHKDKVPSPGTYDLSVPDYPHDKATQYGPYATTWFLIGGSGDKYFHPGFSSLGCVTVKIKMDDTTTWPAIWAYLIDARKDDGQVGTIRIDGS